MSRIDGAAGPIPVGTIGTKTTDNPAATVQVGESKLSEVAQRLGVDADSLQKANPQISDPAKLKVGQEIHLPQFQPSQVFKQNDEAGLQSQGSPSGLPRAPIGDALTKNVVQARLSSTDLAQVPGGAQQADVQQMKFANKVINSDKPLEANKMIGTEKAFHKDDLSQVSGALKQVNIQHMKFADKMPTSDALSNASKWSKADKPLGLVNTTGEEKAFQKADDLAQVAGGSGHLDLQQIQMKESRRAIPANKVIDAGKPTNTDKTIKMDKSTDPEKTFIKMDEATKIFEVTQDVTVNKAKTADKAFDKMDGYIRQ